MFHYNLTNDLRISNLEDSLYEAAELIQSDNVPTAEQNKSKNNNINTLKFYFNIRKDNNITKAILGNQTRKVIINFVKKFQFPNIRKKQDFVEQKNDNIIIAPLRICFRLLYIAFLSDGSSGYITRQEIIDFIIFNENISKKRTPDLISIYKEIKENRNDKTKYFYSDQEIDDMWKQCDRQLRDLLNILVWSECVTENDKNYKLNISELSLFEKGDMFDILVYDRYWEYPDTQNTNELKESYYKYMDLSDSELVATKGVTISYDSDLIFGGQNIIYYGAPGTGKSFIVDEKTKDYSYRRRVTFHPEYTYFDFVGGLKPIQEDSEVRYEFVPGPFTEAIVHALNNPNSKCALIIEEINRANTAAVFGDLFQLLDRKSSGISEYIIKNKEVVDYIVSMLNESAKLYYYQRLTELSGDYSESMGQQLFLPSNVWLYATMNSSDQGVFVMDSAFKRRWEFIYIPIDFSSSVNNNIIVDGFKITWEKFAVELNDTLVKINGITEDKLIGPYFLKKSDLSDKEKVASKLLIYLWDDVVRYQRDSLFVQKDRFSKLVQDFKKGNQIFIDELNEKLITNINEYKENIENGD